MPGEIRDAIFDVLQEQPHEVSLSQIRQAVAERIKGELSESSVRSYLRLNTPEKFERTAHGTYKLAGVVPQPRAEAIKRPQVRPAFVYGRSTLYEMDCLDWLASARENSIQAIVTDPP